MAERGAALQGWIRALAAIGAMGRDPGLTLAGMLDDLAGQHADRPALLFSDRATARIESMTYAVLAKSVNQAACVAHARWPGATIGLLMANRPELVTVWLGLTRAGCIVALLNPALSGAVLRHAIGAASCDLVLGDDALLPLDTDVPIMALSEWQAGLGDAAPLRPPPPAPLPPPPGPADVALLVFTSGTTGLPKAAKVTHGRVLEWALWFAGMMDVQPDDRIYDCLPLYHSTGGIVAVGAALVRGAAVVIAPGFSAGRFWDEVAETGCTIFFYIGELCRYLLASPAAPRAHRLRLAVGNGMHGSVWEPFQARFAIPQVLEFYAATEGNISLYNVEGRPGAIGRVPPFLAQRFPLALIRIDPATGQPVRGNDGYCVRCDVGESGEALGPVEQGQAMPARKFDGYTDDEASARKVLRDVFSAGDRWFRSGDLMRRDAAGFHYFVDRMGDTFRWKGQNVSTNEVAAVLRAYHGVRDAIVYGVAVPGREGRAGMASIVADGLDREGFHSWVEARLPSYAQPVFVRLCPALDLTGTFKLSATRLASEGYEAGEDVVWIHDRKLGRYIDFAPDLLKLV